MSANCADIVPHHVGGFFDFILRILGIKRDNKMSDAELVEYIVKGPVASALGWSKADVEAELAKWCEADSPSAVYTCASLLALSLQSHCNDDPSEMPPTRHLECRKNLGEQLAVELKADHDRLTDAQRRGSRPPDRAPGGCGAGMFAEVWPLAPSHRPSTLQVPDLPLLPADVPVVQQEAQGAPREVRSRGEGAPGVRGEATPHTPRLGSAGATCCLRLSQPPTAAARTSLREALRPQSAIQLPLLSPRRAPPLPPRQVGISAPQGCGKTTIVEQLHKLFEAEGARAASVSIDDYYLTARSGPAPSALAPGAGHRPVGPLSNPRPDPPDRARRRALIRTSSRTTTRATACSSSAGTPGRTTSISQSRTSVRRPPPKPERPLSQRGTRRGLGLPVCAMPGAPPLTAPRFPATLPAAELKGCTCVPASSLR